jgi:hypothetical protein
MGKSTVEVTINRPAHVVWDAIRDCGNVAWRGGMSCTVEGDVRTVRPQSMDLVIEETEIHHDEANRTCSYRVTAMRGETKLDLGGGNVIDLASMVGHHGDGDGVPRLLQPNDQQRHDVGDSGPVLVFDEDLLAQLEGRLTGEEIVRNRERSTAWN